MRIHGDREAKDRERGETSQQVVARGCPGFRDEERVGGRV
jgi:hypothetical protein